MSSGFSSYAQGSLGDFISKLEQALPTLPKQEAKIAQFMLLNLNTLGSETGKSLSVRVGVTEITIGRLMRRLGYNGTKDFKELLRQHYAVGGNIPSTDHELDPHYEKILEAEISVIRNVVEQTTNEHWRKAANLVTNSDRIYVTGFQSVRGLAQDFSTRLSLARPDVQYMSPHDAMLGEWLSPVVETDRTECLLLVDVVPYASESQELATIAKEQGRVCIVVSDEFCHWSSDIADAAIYAPSNTSMFLESTIGVNLILALLMDEVARYDPERSKERLTNWKKMHAV